MSDSAYQEKLTPKSDSTPSTRTSRLMLISAWIAILLGCDLLHILLIGFLGYKNDPLWDPLVRMAALAVLFGLTCLWSWLRPLRGFLLALVAFILGTIPASLVLALPAIKALPPYLFVFANAPILAILPGGLMALTLIGSGLSRRELYLVKGDMRAKSRLRVLNRLPISWTQLGPILIVVAVIPLVFQLTVTIQPDFAMVQHILPALPVIMAFAVINAIQEEFRFRAVFLARLIPILGAGQATWLTTVLFGLAHWVGGHPGGQQTQCWQGFSDGFWLEAFSKPGGLCGHGSFMQHKTL